MTNGVETILVPSIGVIVTLAALSFLYKENIFYRIVEHMFVGYAAAHALIVGVIFIKESAVDPMAAGDYLLIVPLLLSAALFLRFWTKGVFVSRWPLALIIGGALGLNMAAVIPANLTGQVMATVLPFNTLDNIVLVIGAVTGVFPFFFTERIWQMGGRPLQFIVRLGRLFILVYLAVTFANVTLTRLTVSAGRLLDLLKYLNIL